jgi:FKBP-type peptidyl-prolyl cis-trans isomerase
MPLGAKYRFRIPWKLAYGERGSPPDIPPRSDLEFDIELLAVTEGMPLPKFRKGNKERQITTESGLVYEVLVEGKGDTPRDDQGVKLAFGLWTKDGEYIQSTAASERYIGGPIDELRIGPLPMKFLPEAARLMKTGTVLRLEVPAKLCWGDRRMHPALKPGDVTVWQLLLDRITDIPKYREPNPEKAVTTADGIVYEILTKGEGRRADPKVGVEVRYTAWVVGGKRFDSSHARGETVNFPLKRAHPPGMAKAIGLMREGDVYLVSVPKELGYGEKVPRGSGIPKDAALVFLVELVKIIR